MEVSGHHRDGTRELPGKQGPIYKQTKGKTWFREEKNILLVVKSLGRGRCVFDIKHGCKKSPQMDPKDNVNHDGETT